MADETKTRILDAAERLYAEHGVAATSLRSIMKEAGANTAAIHYHFGSRAGLIHALLARRAEPVNLRREEMLADLERRHPEGPLPVDGVVRAFFLPVLEVRTHPEYRNAYGWIGRMVLEGLEPQVIGQVFGPTFERFSKALRRAVPDLTEPQAQGRMRLMIGVMMFALNAPDLPGRCFDRDIADAFEDIIAFTAAGLSAPVGVRSGKEQS